MYKSQYVMKHVQESICDEVCMHRTNVYTLITFIWNIAHKIIIYFSRVQQTVHLFISFLAQEVNQT